MQEIDKTISYMNVMYGIDNPLFSDLSNDTQYLLHTLLPWLVKYKRNLRQIKKLNQPVDEYLMKFTDNRQIVDMITQHFSRRRLPSLHLVTLVCTWITFTPKAELVYYHRH